LFGETKTVTKAGGMVAIQLGRLIKTCLTIFKVSCGQRPLESNEKSDLVA
jgi:hypothetical protein